LTGKTGRYLRVAALSCLVAVYRPILGIGAMAVDLAWRPDRLVTR